MTSFNEWLHQRDENIYNELFDKSEEEVEAKLPGSSFRYDEITPDRKPVKIYLSKIGEKRLKNSVQHTELNSKNLERVGSELMNILKKIPMKKDIDVTPIRQKFIKHAPSSVLTLDTVLKTFARRSKREVGNNGNLLFSLTTASIALKTGNKFSYSLERPYKIYPRTVYNPPSLFPTEEETEADRQHMERKREKHERLKTIRDLPGPTKARQKTLKEELKRLKEELENLKEKLAVEKIKRPRNNVEINKLKVQIDKLETLEEELITHLRKNYFD